MKISSSQIAYCEETGEVINVLECLGKSFRNSCNHKIVSLQVPETVYSQKEDCTLVSPDIDEGISELIKILWSIGIVPTGSCESVSQNIQINFATFEKKDNLVWLQFSSEHYKKFMSLLCTFTEPKDGDLYDRIIYENGFYTRFNVIDANCHIRDFFEDFQGTKFDGPDIDINCNVYFDRSLLEEVVTKLKK